MKKVIHRAKSINNKWVYGFLVNANHIRKISIDGNPGKVVKIIPNTVGEYTNYNDIKGFPIYEGDILRVLMRDDCYYYLKVKFDDMDVCIFDNNGLGANLNYFKDYIVIGNIFDNQELIEREGN